MNELPCQELIEKTKKDTEQAAIALLKTFSFVPEDRMKWSPSPTARTPLWLIAHCGASNVAFAAILRGEPVPLPSDPAEAAAFIRVAGKDTATASEGVQSVQMATAEILKALDEVTDAMLDSSPDSPFGPLPFLLWMQIPSLHMTGHARQIDYLQTIWGDVADH